MKRILVVGLPRSATTWVGQVLGATEGARYVGEPDNDLRTPFALLAKRALRMGDFPALKPGVSAPQYALLWDNAFAVAPTGIGAFRAGRRRIAGLLYAGVSRRTILAASRQMSRRRSARMALAERLAVPERPRRRAPVLVVKSVYSPLSVEWIADRIPLQVVVVVREPLGVLSSWARLEWLGRPGEDMLDLLAPKVRDDLAARWGVEPPPPGASVVSRAAWMVGALTCALSDAASRHPDWRVTTHEALLDHSEDRFRELAGSLGLSWGVEDARRLAGMNREGGAFEPFRVADQLKDAWRARLSPEDAREATGVLEGFPLSRGALSRGS